MASCAIVALAHAVIHHVAQRRVVLVHGLTARPVQGLTRVVLLVAYPRDFRHSGCRVGEIHQKAVEDRQGLAGCVVIWQADEHGSWLDETDAHLRADIMRRRGDITYSQSGWALVPTTLAIHRHVEPAIDTEPRIFHCRCLQIVYKVINQAVLPAVSAIAQSQEKYCDIPQ